MFKERIASLKSPVGLVHCIALPAGEHARQIRLGKVGHVPIIGSTGQTKTHLLQVAEQDFGG